MIKSKAGGALGSQFRGKRVKRGRKRQKERKGAVGGKKDGPEHRGHGIRRTVRPGRGGGAREETKKERQMTSRPDDSKGKDGQAEEGGGGEAKRSGGK